LDNLFIKKHNFKYKAQKISLPFNFKINMYIKVNGKIINVTEEVCNNGKMDRYIKDIGVIMLLMVRVDLFMQMEMFMLDYGAQIEQMAKVIYLN
jgi:hypothetical protein